MQPFLLFPGPKTSPFHMPLVHQLVAKHLALKTSDSWPE